MEVQRRGDFEWFKALEKRWENRPRAPPPPPKTASTREEVEQHRARLTAFYKQHNPAKLDSIDETLQKYRDKEDELFERLETRYCSNNERDGDGDDAYPQSLLTTMNHSRPLCFMVFSTHADTPVKIQLFADITPLAAENFRQLCRQSDKYCQSKIHRIVPGMCVQGGDYTTGDGTGGRSIYQVGERLPGISGGGAGVVDMWGKFPDDATFLAHNAPGLVSMANNGKNTNSSQFFFTLAPLNHLNGKHVVFGRVVEGLDVILSLGRQPTTAATQRPTADIAIVDCGEIVLDPDGQQTWIRASDEYTTTVSSFAAPSTFSFTNNKTTQSALFATSGTSAVLAKSGQLPFAGQREGEEPPPIQTGTNPFAFTNKTGVGPSSAITSSSSASLIFGSTPGDQPGKLQGQQQHQQVGSSFALFGGSINTPSHLSFGSLALRDDGNSDQPSQPLVGGTLVFGQRGDAVSRDVEAREDSASILASSGSAFGAMTINNDNKVEAITKSHADVSTAFGTVSMTAQPTISTVFGGAAVAAAGGLTFGSLAQRAGSTLPVTFGSLAHGSAASSSLIQSSTAPSSAFSSFGAAAATTKPSIFGNATNSSAFGGSASSVPTMYGNFTTSQAFLNPPAAPASSALSSTPAPSLSGSGFGGPPALSLFGKEFNEVPDKMLTFRGAKGHDIDSETSENVPDDSNSGDEAGNYHDDDDGSEYVDNSDQRENSSSTEDDFIDCFHLDSGDGGSVDITAQIDGRTRSNRRYLQRHSKELSSLAPSISDTISDIGATTTSTDANQEEVVSAIEVVIAPPSPPPLFRDSAIPRHEGHQLVEPKCETTMAMTPPTSTVPGIFTVAPSTMITPSMLTMDAKRGASTAEKSLDSTVIAAIHNVSAPPPPLFGVTATANSTTSNRAHAEYKTEFGKYVVVASPSSSFRGMPPANDNAEGRLLDTSDPTPGHTPVGPPATRSFTNTNAELIFDNTDDATDEKADIPTLSNSSSGQHHGPSSDSERLGLFGLSPNTAVERNWEVVKQSAAKQNVSPDHDRRPDRRKTGAISEALAHGLRDCPAGSRLVRECHDTATGDKATPIRTTKTSYVDIGASAETLSLPRHDNTPRGLMKVPEEVVCGDDVFLDALEDEQHLPPLERSDTMRRKNISSPCTKLSVNVVATDTDNDRPPERIEFETAERSCGISIESHDAFTPNSSRVDDNDRLARQSVGDETLESELVHSTVTLDSSVSGQVEMLRRDIETSSLDIKEALRRLEWQKERVRSHQHATSSLTNTPTHYSRRLLPPTPPASTKADNNSSGTAARVIHDVDPAGRFVYLSRIANKFVKSGGDGGSTTSRRSFPDEVVLASTPPRRQSTRYRQPVLVEDKDLEELQRESRSVQPLVATFEKWTKDHVEKQKKERTSPVKHEPASSDSKGSK